MFQFWTPSNITLIIFGLFLPNSHCFLTHLALTRNVLDPHPSFRLPLLIPAFVCFRRHIAIMLLSIFALACAYFDTVYRRLMLYLRHFLPPGPNIASIFPSSNLFQCWTAPPTGSWTPPSQSLPITSSVNLSSESQNVLNLSRVP